MKALVTTVAAIRELAAGLAPEAIPASPVLYQYDTAEATFLLASSDSSDSQRVVIVRDTFEKDTVVPDALSRNRREVLGRLASFVERTQSLPVSLPRGWGQYKHDNMIAFRAVPSGGAESVRWIAEFGVGDHLDVILWTSESTYSKATLEQFAESKPARKFFSESQWQAAFAAAESAFAASRRPSPVNLDMNLPPLGEAQTYIRSFESWMSDISRDQLDFIEAPTEKSIRLRGPAGSGKTLALTLKSVREYLAAASAGGRTRILFVTHSWALTTQVQNAIDSMGVSPIPDIDVFPLLAIAQVHLPSDYLDSSITSLIGDDSLSGKQAQLDEISEVLDDFIKGDWISFSAAVNPDLRARFDSEDSDVRLALAWDLLIEFGSVIGASGIFPGAGAELRYFQLTRAPWMLPLQSRGDLRMIYELYARYVGSLDERLLVTSDQLLADFVSYLETHAWNRRRKTEGYDLIFVDEFHLFNPLERQVLQYLTRDVTSYPRLFMAADPRQSPSSAFIGVAADETFSSAAGSGYEVLGDVSSFELTTVHRFTPQILDLVKHVHLAFPTLFLGRDWDIDFSKTASSKDAGPIPRLTLSGSRSAEETDVYNTVRDLYSSGRIAIAVVDSRQWGRFSEFAGRLGSSGKFHVSLVTGRSDIEGIGYRSRGVVIGAAEHLAGLQFDYVLAAGIPDMNPSGLTTSDKTRLLSMLYLAISRAERDVRIFVNEDDGGAPDVLLSAVDQQLLALTSGSAA